MPVWETKPLGDVCEILDSRRKPVTKTDRRAGKYPYYGATGVVDYVDEFIFDESLVLVGEDGAKWASGERTAFGVSGRCWVNNHAHVVRPMRTRLLDEWLVYYLVHEDLSPFVSGLTVPKLNQGSLREIPVPLPPVAEQRRIVAILDEAFEGISTARANSEENLQNAQDVLANHLEHVFAKCCEEWPETHLGAIAEIKGGKRVPKGYKLLEEDTGYPYLRVTDFGLRGSIDTSDLRYVSSTVHAGIKNYIVTPADLYISIAGTIGRAGIVPHDLDGANLTENACRLVFKPGVSNRFVFYFTRTPSFIEQAGFNTRTAAQPKLALSRLATIRLPLPKPEVQASVVVALDRIAEEVETLEGVYRAKVIALDELKKSLLHQAFKGAL